MKKNSKLHIALETKLFEKIKQEAKEQNIPIAELCRQRLKKNSQLTRIELMLERIIERRL